MRRYFRGIGAWTSLRGIAVVLLNCILIMYIFGATLYSGLNHSYQEEGKKIIIKYNFKQNETFACQIPVLDPFDPKVMAYLRKYPTLNCKGNSPRLVDVVGKELKIDQAKVKAKLKVESIDGCKYRSIAMMPEKDFMIMMSKWSKIFKTSTRLKNVDEYLVVECFLHRTLVSRTYITLAKKRDTKIEKRRLLDYHNHVKTSTPKETLSLLFVGVDGISRESFIRSMPKTRKFIQDEMKAIGLKQLNKVGLNTFPNILPLLTGLTEEELPNWNDSIPFDAIDHLFLWNSYQKAGYRTAAMFDNGWMTAFHYFKKGWTKPPFDFYPRPIILASENDKFYRMKNDRCMGDTPEPTQLLDYWLQLTTLYNNTPSTPYFFYSFLSMLTHDHQSFASAGDELYLEFLRELTRRNVLNNTLLIFFSDHGARFGPIRSTYNGMIEAKSPIMYFVFPSWFEKKYQNLMENFRTNTHRLTTVFDVHATLKELLTFNGKTTQYSPIARGISLFSEIPTNRTCNVAGIPMKFCACLTMSQKNIDSKMGKMLTVAMMKHIIQYTNKYRDKCELLRLKEIKNMFFVIPEVELEDINESLYYVSIETIPGNAVYEAHLKHNSQTNDVEIKGYISRLNLFKGQAECVKPSIRYFCYCKKYK